MPLLGLLVPGFGGAEGWERLFGGCVGQPRVWDALTGLRGLGVWGLGV